MEDLVKREIKFEGYARCKTKIGLIYHSLDSVEKARMWYISVMHDDLINDDVRDFWLGDFEVKGNYKHTSCYQMAVSYYNEGDYDKSIEYYKLALDSFRYYHFSGTSVGKRKVKICNNIADLYSKKSDITTAFSYLLPLFESIPTYDYLARNKAARIIKEHKLKDYYLTTSKRDYRVLIDDETIVLNLGGNKIILKDMAGQNKTKKEIEDQAKYYWRLLNYSDIINELKK